MADRAVATQFAFKKVDAPKHHLKGFEREQARKHKWQTDTIDMQLLNSEGAPVENGFFKCPRNKLTGEFLQVRAAHCSPRRRCPAPPGRASHPLAAPPPP
jgi:hypothetical protein